MKMNNQLIIDCSSQSFVKVKMRMDQYQTKKKMMGQNFIFKMALKYIQTDSHWQGRLPLIICP